MTTAPAVTETFFARVELLKETAGEDSLTLLFERDPVLVELLRENPQLRGELEDFLRVVGLVDGSKRESQTWRQCLPEIPGIEIRKEVGRGGMSVVYCARQSGLDRLVAVKVLLLSKLHQPSAVIRFQMEAEAIGRLKHANIVEVYDAGTANGLPFIVEEFLEGGTLADRLRQGPTEIVEAARAIQALAVAVEHAHRHGIVHRDLKPSNVLVAADGKLKVADFGLAKWLESDRGLTETGAIAGTPAYMASEQVEGRSAEIGPLTDVYALGVLLYEMLAGRPPFVGNADVDTLRRVVEDEPASLRSLLPDIPRDLEAICAKCLEKPASHRYASAGDLADDVGRFLDGLPVIARPITRFRRLARWGRRRPSHAALALLCCVMVIGVAVGGWWHSLQLGKALATSESLRQTADEEKRNAEEREASVRRHLFCLDAHTARQALTLGNWGQAVRLLRQYEDDPTVRSSFVWRYLWRLSHLEERAWPDLGGEVYSVRFSPDGRRLAAGGITGRVFIWDVSNGKQLSCLRGHTSCVNCIRFTPGGARIITTSCDGSIRIWKADTAEEECVVEQGAVPFFGAAISPDGTRLAAGAGDSEKACRLSLWELPRPRKLATVDLGKGRVEDLEFSGDGRFLAVVAHRTLVVYKTAKGLIESDRSSGGGPAAVTFVRGRSRIAWSGVEPFLYLAYAGSATGTLRFGSETTCLAADAKGDVLVRGAGNIAELWNVERDKRLAALSGHTNRIDSVAVTADGRHFATGSLDGTVKLWSAGKPAESMKLAGVNGADQLAFGAGGSLLVVCGGGFVSTLDTVDWHERFRCEGDRFALSSVEDSPLLATHRGGRITVRSVETGAERGSIVVDPKGIGLREIAISAHGRSILVSKSRQLQSWDVPRGRLTRVVDQGVMDFLSVAVSPANPSLIATSNEFDARVILRDYETGRIAADLAGATNYMRQVRFSPDGSRLAGACSDRMVYVWDIGTSALTQTLTGHYEPVNCVAFSADGRTLASGDDGGAVRLWDLDSRHEALVLKAHSQSVRTVAFSPDGRLLVSGSSEAPQGPGEVKVWIADPQ